MKTINIPVGISSFAEIRRKGSYFIDKSGLIVQLLKTQGTKATLITRPRRFGKTLCMSMLAEFFDIQKKGKHLFDGLSVMENEELCRRWMNQYPTLFLTFRSVDGLNFSGAYAQLVSVIADIYKKHIYLAESERLHPLDQEQFYRIAEEKSDLKDIKNSLLKLTRLMEVYYGKPVVLIIDEYDVPLAKASEKGYYSEMLDVVKGLMQVMKDNDSLELAVITGCLRIAKESIFTGTNNFVSDTISDTKLNEYFGFTQDEVNRLLLDTGLTSYGGEIKEWYNGYRFGDFDVYCPWDVMNHVQNLLLNPDSKPKNFWENTSDNAIIRNFLKRRDFDVNDKFETLLAGGYIVETIEENLTYDVLEGSEENLWSLLYLTGYLTMARPEEITDVQLLPGQYALKIPNKEVLGIFKKSVKAWLMETTAQTDRRELFAALWEADAKRLTELISNLLFDTISYHDYAESFYHAFLTGLFSNAGYRVESNYEYGLGRSDIVVKDRKNRRAVVLEAKRASNEDKMESDCEEALAQIQKKQYAKKAERDGYKNVGRLGVAFFQKRCLVKKMGMED